MASRRDLPAPNRKKSYIPFFDKIIFKLSKTTGLRDKKVFNKETRKLEPTGEKTPWKLQVFSISLGITGTTPLGFIEVQYWGDKELIEGKLIHKGYYYLKQVKWSVKDPNTFVSKNHSKHILIMEDFDYLEDMEDKPSKKYAKPKDPVAAGMEEYYADKHPVTDVIEVAEEDKMVDINQEIPQNDIFKVEEVDFGEKIIEEGK